MLAAGADNAVLVLIALIGSGATVAVGLLNNRRIGQARTVAAVAADALDTHNGKSAGETLRDVWQTLEVISAQVHTNTTELLMVSEKLDRHIEDSQQD